MSWLNIEKGANYDIQGNILRANLHTAAMNNATSINIHDYGNEGTLYIGDNLFNNLPNAVINIQDAKFDKVVSSINMFANCKNLTTMVGINTPNVVNSYRMFANCDGLTSIDNWCFTKLKYATYMFENCKNLVDTMPLTLNNLDIGGMFRNCINFNPSNLIVFNNCTLNAAGYWAGGSPFVNTAIKNLDNLQFINTPLSFSNTKSLEQANIDINANSNLEGVFKDCSNLISVNIISPNEINSVYCNALFMNCTNLSDVVFDNVNTVNGNLIFGGCENLHNVSGVNYFNGVQLFRNARNLPGAMDFIDNMDLSHTTSVQEWFYNTDIEREPNWNWYDFNISTQGLYGYTTNIQDTNGMHVSNGAYLFKNSAITSVSNLIKVGNLTTILWGAAFENCKNLTDIYDLDLVTLNMHTLDCFACDNLTNVTLNAYTEWNMSLNFSNSKFTGINLTLDDNIHINNAANSFNNCTELINMASFTDVTIDNGYSMFNNCRKLTAIGNLYLNNATSLMNFCGNCVSLVNVGKLNFSNIQGSGLSNAFHACNNLSSYSINNIINALLTVNMSNIGGSYNNLSTSNWASPFNGSNITSSRYSSRLSELSAKGWKY